MRSTTPRYTHEQHRSSTSSRQYPGTASQTRVSHQLSRRRRGTARRTRLIQFFYSLSPGLGATKGTQLSGSSAHSALSIFSAPSKRLPDICHIFVSPHYHPTPASYPASNWIHCSSSNEKSVAVHETFANFLRLYW